MNLEPLEALLHASSHAELLERTERIAQSLGFEHFIYALRLLPREDHPGVDLLLGTYPRHYLDLYARENYLAIDPVVRHAMQSTRPLVWSNALFADPGVRDMYADARAAGISAGVALSVHNALAGQIGLFGFALDLDADRGAPQIRSQVPAIQVLTSYVHEAYGRLLQARHPELGSYPRELPELAPLERDCLCWLSGGLHPEAIATRLHLSEQQVLQHLEQARRKLKAISLSQAMARALLLGITHQPGERPPILLDQSGTWHPHQPRAQLGQELERRLARQARTELLILEVHRFERLQDSLPPHTADSLGEHLYLRLRGDPDLGRALIPMTGHQFALLPQPDQRAEALARRAQALLQAPLVLQEHSVRLELNGGIACAPEHGRHWQELLRHAEQALHEAGKLAPGSILHFSPDTQRQLEAALHLESRLRQALTDASPDLSLHYQPIVDTTSGRILGLEALCRWHDPELGQVPPDRFIPLAESCDLIHPLGHRVLEMALQQLATWHSQGLDLFMAVNVSTRQFQDPQLHQRISASLARYGLPPQSLELEITESVLLGEDPQVLGQLETLHRQGIRFAIDDFGTGYASLGYLRRMPVSVLKLDQSFVRGCHGDPRNGALVEAAIRMAASLSLHVVAEGVEEEADRAFLARLGCARWQGYHCSQPKPATHPELCRLLGAPREA